MGESTGHSQVILLITHNAARNKKKKPASTRYEKDTPIHTLSLTYTFTHTRPHTYTHSHIRKRDVHKLAIFLNLAIS